MKRLILSIALPALLAGCASDKTRFWTIEPAAAVRSADLPAAAAPDTAPVQIAAVRLPLAFDRLEVVRHDEGGRMQVLDFDRWSAPPGSLIRVALTQDLVPLLPAGRVIYPDAPAPPGTKRVIVDIIGFGRTTDGYAMQLSWSSVTPPRSHQLDLRSPGADDVAGQAGAMSAMVATLAHDIARGLQNP